MLYGHCFSTLLGNMSLEAPIKQGWTETEWDTSASADVNLGDNIVTCESFVG
jgi:hypothetical protein